MVYLTEAVSILIPLFPCHIVRGLISMLMHAIRMSLLPVDVGCLLLLGSRLKVVLDTTTQSDMKRVAWVLPSQHWRR
ncbi:hypothetical protein BKA60DRAFT_553985 [Fusarium oxysporum]|nr:hypothetical protein BKA60DRAFT_553985 [Fusarium oxysporum]